MLEAMGRATVLVDASGTPPPAPRANAGETGQGLVSTQQDTQRDTQYGSRSTALLQQMAEETGTESLVLTDTAPLAVSAETEYLARFVDCAIVVIESGVTTRAQLRAAAATLQRLDVDAVGFVLNRVGLKKADPAFRRSLRASEDHLDAQSRSLAGRIDESFVPEASPAPGRSFGETAAGTAPAAKAQGDAGKILAQAKPSPVPPRLESSPRIQESRQEFSQPLPKPAEELPWWLADLFPQPDAPAAEPIPPRKKLPEAQMAAMASQPVPAAPKPHAEPPVPDWASPVQPKERLPNLGGNARTEAATEAALQPEPRDTSSHLASRLSGIRLLFSELGMRDERKTETRESARETAPTVHVQTVEPVPDAVSVIGTDSASAGRVTAGRITAQPEFLPPRPLIEAADTKLDTKAETKEGVATGSRDRREAYDDVRILPSRRGQYKRG
jgi:hypothetical protein